MGGGGEMWEVGGGVCVWWWWWWCGPVCMTRMSVHACQRSCKLIETDRRQCASPFGWTDQPENPLRLFSFRRQVPGVPGCKTHPSPSRGKRLRGSPTSLSTASEEGRGAQSFPSPRRWMSGIQDDMRRITWTSLPGKPGPFYPRYYLYPGDDQE